MVTRSKGGLMIGLGVGLCLGALFTRWSPATDGMFLLGGLTLIATGAGRKWKGPQ